MKFLQIFFQNELFFVENSNFASTYFHLKVDPRKLVRWSVELFASQNGLCVVNFHRFFGKCIIFGGKSEFCQQKFWNWIGPPKNLMCMSDSYEWFLLGNLLTFSRHKMACVWWIFPIFFSKWTIFGGESKFCLIAVRNWSGPPKNSMCMSDSSQWFSVKDLLNVHEWLIWVIFSWK